MIIQKYSINNIFKLILIFGIVFVANNSVLANIESNNIQEESPVQSQESTDAENSPAVEDNKVEEPEDTNTNLDDGEGTKASEAEQQLQNSNIETPNNREFLTLKNILLLFAIIDLPIIALFLALWFCDRKEQQQKFNDLANKQNKIYSKLKQLEKITLNSDKFDNFNNEIIEKVKHNKQEIIESIIERLAAFEKKQSERLINSNGNTNIHSNNYHNVSDLNKEPTEHQSDKPSQDRVAVIEQIPQFVSKYNLDKKSLSEKAIDTVAATEASLNERRLGKSDVLILENTTQKKYWIVQEDDYYLVPHAKIKIDEYNKTTLESLFECDNFDSNYKDFHLIEPAKVSQLDSELWQLEKKGKLEFS